MSTISLDGWFKIWAEIPSIPPLSGRRFKNIPNNTIHQHRAPARTPWYSFDIKHDPVTRHTYLALLASNGMLSVYENDQPENMSHWERLDEFEVVSTSSKRQNVQRGRGTNSSTGGRGEIGFKVRFDPNPEPCWRAVNAGMARDGLSLIVADMENARIWRTKEIKHSASLGKTREKEFYMAGELRSDTGLGVIRDVAWAGGSLRGYDIVGLVWSDGTVRIFKIFNPPLESIERPSSDHNRSARSRSTALAANRPSTSPARQPSGIGSQLAGARALNGSLGRQHADILASQAGQIKHIIKEVGRLDAHGGRAQRLLFDADGQVLMTAGDDGMVKVWRMRPNGEWSNSATLTLTGTGQSS